MKTENTLNHSPLPWIAAPGYSMILADVQDDCGEPAAQIYDVESGSKQANAEFIVRAVNNHDALVSALGHLYMVAAEFYGASGDDTAMREARELLEKVKL